MKVERSTTDPNWCGAANSIGTCHLPNVSRVYGVGLGQCAVWFRVWTKLSHTAAVPVAVPDMPAACCCASHACCSCASHACFVRMLCMPCTYALYALYHAVYACYITFSLSSKSFSEKDFGQVSSNFGQVSSDFGQVSS